MVRILEGLGLGMVLVWLGCAESVSGTQFQRETLLDLEGLLRMICMARNPVRSRGFTPYGLYGKKPC